jgi:hypothetical protein
MAILAPDVGHDVVPYVYAVRDDLLQRGRAPASYFSGRYPMRSFRVGTTEYRFRRPMTGRVYPAGAGVLEFAVDALAPYVVGRAATPQEALDDWRNQVHALFQQLLAMRPFEMEPRDRARWRALDSVIDSAQFRRSTPVRMRQLGRVEYLKRPYPCAVHWAGGGRERVSFELMPPEFPSFKPGQWIEAICERDPLTTRLMRVSHVERIPEVRMMSCTQQDQYWENLTTSDSLPESDLDWTSSD